MHCTNGKALYRVGAERAPAVNTMSYLLQCIMARGPGFCGPDVCVLHVALQVYAKKYTRIVTLVVQRAAEYAMLLDVERFPD